MKELVRMRGWTGVVSPVLACTGGLLLLLAATGETTLAPLLFDDGTVRVSIADPILGQLQRNGTVLDPTGAVIGTAQPDGTIRLTTGVLVRPADVQAAQLAKSVASPPIPPSPFPTPYVGGNATSIQGVPVCAPAPGTFLTEPLPSGDTADGIGLFWNPARNCLDWLQAHIDHGPSALSQTVGLVNRQWNLLASAPGPDGFRTGLAAYPPAGVWELDGHLTVSGPSLAEYEVQITVGTTLSAGGFLAGTPVVRGAVAQTWPGPANAPFSFPISAHEISCPAQVGQACEVLVWILPLTDGANAAVLASTAHLPVNFVSSFVVRRVRR